MNSKVFYFFCAGVLGVTTAFAATESKTETDLPIEKQMQAFEKQDQKALKSASQMMGHLTFAAQALDLKLKPAALENLQHAKKLCKQLEKSRPEVISKYQFKYGKTTYTVNGEQKDYYIPVADDVFVQSTFNEKTIWKKNPKVEEKDLSIVHATLKVNLQEVSKAIESAEKLAREEKFEEAAKALDGTFKDALATEEVVTNPVWTVWGNLVLAKEFLNNGKYKSVRFALKAAQTDLEKLEKEGALRKNGAEAKELREELAKVEKTLDEKNPSMAKRLHATFENWAHKVKTWL